MNDAELEKLLRSAETPKREEDYWKNFPQNVTASLRKQPNATREFNSLRPFYFSRWAGWGAALATACLVLTAVLWFQHNPKLPPGDGELAQARKYYHELSGLFPNQVRAIEFNDAGPQLVLSDNADVPHSPPIYVKICGPRGCGKFVTYSGQEIQFEGQRCEVLANSKNEVMLLSSRGVWSEGGNPGGIRVEAEALNAAL